jgi:hypothetical protein
MAFTLKLYGTVADELLTLLAPDGFAKATFGSLLRWGNHSRIFRGDHDG